MTESFLIIFFTQAQPSFKFHLSNFCSCCTHVHSPGVLTFSQRHDIFDVTVRDFGFSTHMWVDDSILKRKLFGLTCEDLSVFILKIKKHVKNDNKIKNLWKSDQKNSQRSVVCLFMFFIFTYLYRIQKLNCWFSVVFLILFFSFKLCSYVLCFFIVNIRGQYHTVAHMHLDINPGENELNLFVHDLF